MALPDFLVIGAMKCGTTTLQEQLADQPGIFMSTPKEPNFFSDDAIHARGMAWYESLFDAAPAGALKGEASTHYTKAPTYPACVDRLATALPHAKLVYVTRDPFRRLVSHYMHERTMGVIRCDLETAVKRHPELVDYGRYAMQIAPYLARYPRDQIFLTSLERLMAAPDAEFQRLAAFLGAAQPFVWRHDAAAANASADRLRRLPLHGVLVQNPVADALRRALVPRRIRDAVKGSLRMTETPSLSDETRARLAPVFEADQAELKRLFAQAS